MARRYRPLLVNTVVGFIGPEYLYDGKQIIRAGLEDHFCGKLLGLPMGCDVCYTNHAEADQDDMDALLDAARRRRLHLHHGRAGRGRHHAQLPEHVVPRRALCPRSVLGKRAAPEFEAWLEAAGIAGPAGEMTFAGGAADAGAAAAGGAGMSEEARNSSIAAPHDWGWLQRFTEARIALGHCGVGLPTAPHLAFQAAHAEARDAVLKPLRRRGAGRRCRARGWPALGVHSRAADRQRYLQRPDRGRACSTRPPRRCCRSRTPPPTSALVVADGLSSRAVEANALAVLDALVPRLKEAGHRLAPVVVATQGRVALADHVGELFQAKASIILIGERPGLSAPRIRSASI